MEYSPPFFLMERQMLIPFHSTSALQVVVVFPVVFDQLLKRDRGKFVDVHPRIQYSGKLSQNLMDFILRIVNMAVDHIAALNIYQRIVAKGDMVLSVINFQKVCY